jgi:hypothetical protein
MLLLDGKVFPSIRRSEHAFGLNDDTVVQHEVRSVGAVGKVFPFNLDVLVVIRDVEFIKVDGQLML